MQAGSSSPAADANMRLPALNRSLMLESVHPDGPGAGVHVIGQGPARELVGEGTAPGGGVLVLSPDPRECRDRRWRSRALHEIASLPRALVLVTSGGPLLRRDLIRLGLRPGLRLLHAPDIARSHILVPTAGPSLAFAASSLLGPRWERLPARQAVQLPVLRRLAPLSQLFVSHDMPAPFDWLSSLGRPLTGCTAIALTSGRPGAATVLMRFAATAEADLVAKVGGRAHDEAIAAGRLRAGAQQAGAVVPEVMWSGTHHGNPVVALQAVAGERWSRRLLAHPARLPELLEPLAAWLLAWNAATAQATALTATRLESFVLAPARRICAAAGLHELLRRVERLCVECEDRVVPLVAAHNDLTAANILLADDGRLGVVDWEESGERCLPLGDLSYAAVDAMAAVDGYRDRAGAFAACSQRVGGPSTLTRRLVTTSARALDLPREIIELCLHACWLGHAANELERDVAAGVRPFGDIAADIAGRPALWVDA
jgi:hypothetical protein